jgi:1,4-dihydroxy-2-naphthoate octaprenyltransferase
MRVTQSGLVSLSTMKKATFLVFLLTSLCGLYLVYQGGIYIAFLLLLSLILAAAYTTGPYPLAYLGLGELFVLVFFGPVSVLGTYFLQTRTLSWEGLWIGIAVGFLSTAILAVANLRDIPEDRLVHKKTAAVRFGPLFAKLEYAVCLIIAAVIPLFIMKTHPFTCLTSLFLIPAIPCIKTVFSYQDPKQLNTILANTGKLLSLYTILFCIGWLIS